jgi:hypothetical protein
MSGCVGFAGWGLRKETGMHNCSRRSIAGRVKLVARGAAGSLAGPLFVGAALFVAPAGLSPVGLHAALANTVNIAEEPDIGSPIGSVSVSGLGSIEGFVGALSQTKHTPGNICLPCTFLGSKSPTASTGFDLLDSGDAYLTSVATTITGGTVSLGARNGSPNPADISIDALYFALKIGTDTAFFENNSGHPITISFAGTELGEVDEFAAVPIPPAMLLFASGVAGLGLLARRRVREPQAAVA